MKIAHIAAVLISVSFATCPKLAIGKEMSSNGHFQIAGKTSRTIQKYTGLTWVGNHLVSAGAGLALKSRLGGKVKVKARSYSFTDMLQGKFETVEVHMKNSKVKGIPMGTVIARTDQPVKVRYFKKNGQRAGVETPVLVSLSGSINEEQVTRALNSKEISQVLRILKLDLPGLGEQQLQILDPEVLLEKDQITLKTVMITKGAAKETGVPLTIVAHPVLEGDRLIVLKETKIDSKIIEKPELFAQFAEELLNPLFDFGRLDRQSHALRVQKLNLSDKEVSFDGKLLLAPKPKAAAPSQAEAKTGNAQAGNSNPLPPANKAEETKPVDGGKHVSENKN